MNIFVRELIKDDIHEFINAMQLSADIHSDWVSPAKTENDFLSHIEKFNNKENYCFIIYDARAIKNILGIVNITNIIRGVFQNGFLSYYVTHHGAKKGIMYHGVKLVLDYAFNELNLHRLEANIQPNNDSSIKLIEKLSFTKEGYSRNYLCINGIWQDHVRYAITNPNQNYKINIK